MSELTKVSHQLLGKKGAMYSLPQKLAATACSDRRLRCKWAGDSGQGRRFRPGSGIAGSSGQTGDSGPEGRRLRPVRRLRTLSGDTPGPYLVPHHKRCNGLRKSLRPEIPGLLGRRLRTISGVPPDPSPVAHHSKSFGSEKQGTGDSGSFGAGDSGVTGDSGPSPGQIQTVKSETHNFCK